ncbi:RWD domain-containing protein 1 [Balamuthia mandrillaris]
MGDVVISSPSPAEQQQTELQTLEALFPSEFKKLEDSPPRFQLCLAEESLLLQVTYSSEYPLQAPLLEVLNLNHEDELWKREDCLLLQAILLSEAEVHLGVPMILPLVQRAKEWAAQCNSTQGQLNEEEENGGQEDYCEDEEENEDDEEEGWWEGPNDDVMVAFNKKKKRIIHNNANTNNEKEQTNNTFAQQQVGRRQRRRQRKQQQKLETTSSTTNKDKETTQNEENEEPAETIERRVALFRKASSELQHVGMVDLQSTQSILEATLDYLKQRYSSRPLPLSPSPSSSADLSCSSWKKVCLEFVSEYDVQLQCQAQTGRIQMGLRTLKGSFWDGVTSRYPLEKRFLEQHGLDKSKEDVLFWFLLHEFMHLFAGGEKHTEEFFKAVLALAAENRFLFSETFCA